jgi:hypothetical protein
MHTPDVGVVWDSVCDPWCWVSALLPTKNLTALQPVMVRKSLFLEYCFHVALIRCVKVLSRLI